jgi:hypothetical protein
MLCVTCKPHLLSVIMLSVVMLSVVMLSVVMLSVIMRSAVMLSVAAPSIPSLKIFICSVMFANFKKLKTMLFYNNMGPILILP